MKRLLFITYEFPPKGGTQSQHTAAVAADLAGLGWDVVVVTVKEPPTPMVDTALAEAVGRVVEVRPAYSLEPTRAVQALRRWRAGKPQPPASATATPATPTAPAATGARGYTGMPRWAIRLIQAFFIPDEKIGWKPYAMREIRSAHAEKPFDAILSSGPPFSAHSIARTAARRLRLPWVADLRDPVTGGYFFKPVTPINAALMRRFETRVARDADRIVTATPWIADELVKRNPVARDKVLTLPNGFRRESFEGLAPAGDDRFTIAYVGTFQASIRPDTFLEAVKQLRDGGSPVAGDLRVRFVGPRDAETDAAVASRGLDAIVERTGFVSQRDAFKAMLEADVMLLVLGPEPASAGILTSKLPEYLGAGKPVLALVPDSVARDVVLRSRAGEVVAPLDAAGAAAAIERLHAQWRAGTLPTPDPAVVAEFDRERITNELSATIDSAIADRAPR